MRSPFVRGIAALISGFLALTTAAQAAPLIPGALLSGAFGPNLMRQYSTAGAVLDAFPILGMVGDLTGTALIGTTVYALDTIGIVYTLDMSTGIAVPQFNVVNITNPESLGNIGGSLLVGDFTGTVQTYSTTGNLLGSFTVTNNFAVTGLDSDGTTIFAATYNFGIVEYYTPGGAFVGGFNSGTGLNHLSSAAYDSDTGTLWTGVTYNTATPTINQYTTGGVLIGGFALGPNASNGLDYIPLNGQGISAPEPSPLALLALAGCGMLVRSRTKSARRKKV